MKYIAKDKEILKRELCKAIDEHWEEAKEIRLELNIRVNEPTTLRIINEKMLWQDVLNDVKEEQ